MKILLAGRTDGWMGVYWSQWARGFRESGAECLTFDYRSADPRGFFRRILPGDSENLLRSRRTAGLISAVKRHKPDALLLHSLRIDLPALRNAFDGTVMYWDIDGPAGPFGGRRLPSLSGIDLLVSLSKPVLRRLQAETDVPAHYLPHGADLDFYRPGALSPSQERRFRAPLVFLGRPTDRRVRLLEPLAREGLAVWGGRWWKRPWRRDVFKPCLRERGNIQGEDVSALYRAAGVVLNISREPFADPPTALNLQVFHVPAAGSCLLTEWVEELEEAFEPDREVLVFRDGEELMEKASRYAGDPEAARRIGEAGHRRCRAHHGLHVRAGRVISLSTGKRG